MYCTPFLVAKGIAHVKYNMLWKLHILKIIRKDVLMQFGPGSWASIEFSNSSCNKNHTVD